MNTTIKCAFAFAGGAAAGAVVSWKLLKTAYERLAQEEINSVKEAFSRKENPTSPAKILGSKSEGVVAVDEKPDMMEYAARLAKAGYTDYSACNGGKEKEEAMNEVERPTVIPPDEYGDYPEYEHIDLTHYADGVLTDENDEIVDDVENTVGTDYAEHFGEFEDDVVHVRNDKLQCYYEICRDHRTYSDVVGRSPH